MRQLLRILPLVTLFLFQLPNTQAAVFAVSEATNQAYLQSQFGTDNLDDFVSMSVKDLAEARGEKLTFKEKLAFKLVQRQVKRKMKKGERVDLKSSFEDAAPDVNIGGFLLGFILGLIGVLIAFLIDRDLVTSALYGLLAWLIILVLVFLL